MSNDEDVISENFSDESSELNSLAEDTHAIIGEVEELSDEVEEIHPPSGETQPLPLSLTFKHLVGQRIACLQHLENLETARKEFIATHQLPENLVNALAAQTAELKILPELKIVREKQQALIERIQAAKKRAANPDDPTALITPQLEQVWRFAAKQYDLLAQRGKLLKEVINTAVSEYATTEPLLILAKHFNYDATKIFGLAIYQLALEASQNGVNGERKRLQQQLAAENEKKSGFFGREKPATDALQAKITRTTKLLACFTCEIASLQKMLIDDYWHLYEFAACLLVSGRAEPTQLLPVRLLLRFGLLGHAPYFLPPSAVEFMRTSCTADVRGDYNFSASADHVLYADEYLTFIAENQMTASIDENLELAMRNSPEWYNDKAERRLAYTRNREVVLRECIENLTANIIYLRQTQEKLTAAKAKLIRNMPEFKPKSSELGQKIQHCKVEAARFERIIDKIKNNEIPTLRARAQEAKERLQNSPVKSSRLQTVRKEVAALHRVCRLTARLKETFPPFSLRDYFRPENKTVNDRATMLAMLKEIEKADRRIFQEVLVNSRKETQRIYLRFYPVFLLAPNYGFVGYSWNPRSGTELGKLVFPLYCPRAGIQQRIMYNMLADFRWDTSKAAAGVDLLTSDTLVAAYAAARWDYRKRKRENREKALIFNEINDRQNWRRHYELFLDSAMDAGKKLFFKNSEVYDVICKYIGLPEGCEKLKI